MGLLHYRNFPNIVGKLCSFALFVVYPYAMGLLYNSRVLHLQIYLYQKPL